jgi:hypothetical protein
MTLRKKILLRMLAVSVGMTVNGWEWFELEIMEKYF